MLELLLNNGFKISYLDDKKDCLIQTNIEKLMTMDNSGTLNIFCEHY